MVFELAKSYTTWEFPWLLESEVLLVPLGVLCLYLGVRAMLAKRRA